MSNFERPWRELPFRSKPVVKGTLLTSQMACKFRGMMTMMMLTGRAGRQGRSVGPCDSGDSPRRAAVSRRWRRRRLLSVLTAMIVAGMVATACSSRIAGSPSAAEEGDVVPVEVPAYEPPADGSGFATQPMDQAFPLPSWFWSGRQDICDGITAEVVAQAGGVTMAPNPAGCNIKFSGTEVVQVALAGPYNWITDPTHFVRPVTIAGLEGRERALSTQGLGECTVEVNTRSPLSLMAVAWNPANPNGGDRELRCATARKVVEAIVTRYVPAAGGTPWPATPQAPPADASAGMTACEIVNDSAAVYGATSPKSKKAGTDPLGTTCTYASNSTELVGFVTDDGTNTGLDDIEPRVPHAEVTDRTLATLPARQEAAGNTCALLVEFTPGRVLGITHEVGADGAACKFAEVVAAVVLYHLVDETPG